MSAHIRSIATVLLSFPGTALGQCPLEWSPGDGVQGRGGGSFGGVAAITEWDPDGPGPEPQVLVAGGSFTAAGEVLAPGLASWDGRTWKALPSVQVGTITALRVYNGELIAAGDAGVRIARFSGAAWQPLGGGANGTVYALAEYNGELIAGGFFTFAGGVLAPRIARWSSATSTRSRCTAAISSPAAAASASTS